MEREVPDIATITTFGELLKHLRKRARLTQAELGTAVGYSYAHVARLERGERLPDVATVRTRFVEALELDDEPALARRLVELAERTRGGSPPGLSPHPQPTSVAPHPTNLPAQLTRFVGRELEMAEVRRLIGANRLVTLTGAGGVGKTRLAVETGAALRPKGLDSPGPSGDGLPPQAIFPDGVWLAELAPLSDPVLVPQAVAAVFKLPEQPGRSHLEALTTFLHGKRLLLILDNCEHLIEPCARLAESLLRACPELHVLAISREALRVPGEVVWRVPSLSTPDPEHPPPPGVALDYEAVELFLDRAVAARPDFELTPEGVAVVARICHRLDGIPLAIELAAARTSALPVGHILTHLDDRFSLLTRGSRTALPRQQTLRATIDWSHDLLTGEESVLFHRLAVFVGGWTLAAAHAVGGGQNDAPASATLEVLLRLADKSLVHTTDEEDGEVRFRLLETIRAYAHDRLLEAGEYAQTRQRHLEFFTALARSSTKVGDGPEYIAWRDRMVIEIDNLRAALDWVARNRDVHCGEELIEGMMRLWYDEGYVAEGMRWVEAILPEGDALSDRTRLKRDVWLGKLTFRRSDFKRARDQFAAVSALAHRLADDDQILSTDACRSYLIADHAEALRITRENLLRAQRLGWRGPEADALGRLGWRLRIMGNYVEAAEWFARSTALWRELGSQDEINYNNFQLGLMALARSDLSEARALFEACVALARQMGVAVNVAWYLTGLATVAAHQGDYAQALSAVRESITTFHRTGDLYRTAQCAALAACVALGTGQPERAARLLGAAAALRRDFLPEFLWVASELHEEYERCLPLTRAALGEPAFSVEYAVGQRMVPNEAVEYALRWGEANEPPKSTGSHPQGRLNLKIPD